VPSLHAVPPPKGSSAPPLMGGHCVGVFAFELPFLFFIININIRIKRGGKGKGTKGSSNAPFA